MPVLNVLLSVALSTLITPGTSTWVHHLWESASPRMGQVRPDVNRDTTRMAGSDTIPFMGQSLRYGMDTTVSPCLDFYQYVNGAWRSRTLLESTSPFMVDVVHNTSARTRQRLQIIIDSARSIVATTNDPTLKALGTFYESCLVADSLERVLRLSTTPLRDSTRAEQCLQRTITNLGGALGQIFAQELLAPHAMTRIQQLLEAIRLAVVTRLEHNRWMTPEEKSVALERLRKLHLRIGMPTKMVDYQSLVLSPTNYSQNKNLIRSFNSQTWVNTIGGNDRDRWTNSLLILNPFYNHNEHTIEIPAVTFMPPFFNINSEDAINFAGIGSTIGHEIFHSVADQLPALESADMKTQIERLKATNSDLGTIDGWNTNGKRTFPEDIADLGGVLVAYDAWKATIKANKTSPAALVDGLTPDQRFFVALARIWRAKWQSPGYSNDAHAAPFARVNAMVIQSPAFAKAFGCKETDPMVLSANKRATIW